MALAALTSVIWGLAFVAVKLGLESFSAPQLTAIRFLIACLPALVVPRPRISWGALGLIGLTLFTGQFLLLFFAYTQGMPPGLASVSQQTQAFFTVLLAAVFLRDRPTLRQCAGMGIALRGPGPDRTDDRIRPRAGGAGPRSGGRLQLGRRERPGQAATGRAGVPAGGLGEPRAADPGDPARGRSRRPSSTRPGAPRGSASRPRSTWASRPPCSRTPSGAASSSATRPPWWRPSRSSRRAPASSRRRCLPRGLQPGALCGDGPDRRRAGRHRAARPAPRRHGPCSGKEPAAP